MARILIIYPILFKSYEKFSRKIGRIVENIKDPEFVFYDDPNGFTEKLCLEKKYQKERIGKEFDFDEITHAVVFDDGEEFIIERSEIIENKIPRRFIKINITRVINIKKDSKFNGLKSTPEYEYIGRGSYWGNPYSMYEGEGSREDVIRKFKHDFDFDKFPNKKKSEVFKLSGKRLGCFCKPEDCHGDVLADFLNSWDDGK